MRVKNLDTNFIFNQIRAYNKAQKPKLKDRILHAAGAYAELLSQEAILRGELTDAERNAVLFFLIQFCEFQGLKVEISESKVCFAKGRFVLEAKI